MLLDIEGLNISLNRGLDKAIKSINFSVDSGEVLGIIGESGCGKSMTNLALMGLLPRDLLVSATKCIFNGIPLLDLSEKQWNKIRGLQISMIFQNPNNSLNPCFTVGYQLRESLVRKYRSQGKKWIREKSLELLDSVGIINPIARLNSYPHELSGGMAQRVMIAIAIACEPKLLIADEPTTALDAHVQTQILDLILDIKEKSNMGVIFVSHDIGVISYVSDRVQVMYSGEIIETNTTQDVIYSPAHPYTKGLLSSLPQNSVSKRIEKFETIDGQVPLITEKMDGCRFFDRCHVSKTNCASTRPSWNEQLGYLCHIGSANA